MGQEEENSFMRNVGQQEEHVSGLNPRNQEEQKGGRVQWEVWGKEKKSLRENRKKKINPHEPEEEKEKQGKF